MSVAEKEAVEHFCPKCEMKDFLDFVGKVSKSLSGGPKPTKKDVKAHRVKMTNEGYTFVRAGVPADVYKCPECGYIEFWAGSTELRR